MENKKLSDARRFVDGFKKLVLETNMVNVKRNLIGPISFSFKDGSEFGTNWLLKEVGFK